MTCPIPIGSLSEFIGIKQFNPPRESCESIGPQQAGNTPENDTNTGHLQPCHEVVINLLTILLHGRYNMLQIRL